MDVLLRKSPFSSIIDTNSGLGRDWDTLWKKFHDSTFTALQMKVFFYWYTLLHLFIYNLVRNLTKNIKFCALGQKCQIGNFWSGTFDPGHGIWNFLWPNTFIRSVMNVLLLNFFHNVSQFLPNPEFVSIKGKKVIFSKGHQYSISILVS